LLGEPALTTVPVIYYSARIAGGSPRSEIMVSKPLNHHQKTMNGSEKDPRSESRAGDQIESVCFSLTRVSGKHSPLPSPESAVRCNLSPDIPTDSPINVNGISLIARGCYRFKVKRFGAGGRAQCSLAARFKVIEVQGKKRKRRSSIGTKSLQPLSNGPTDTLLRFPRRHSRHRTLRPCRVSWSRLGGSCLKRYTGMMRAHCLDHCCGIWIPLKPFPRRVISCSQYREL
jgi:hypothetical protein